MRFFRSLMSLFSHARHRATPAYGEGTPLEMLWYAMPWGGKQLRYRPGRRVVPASRRALTSVDHELHVLFTVRQCIEVRLQNSDLQKVYKISMPPDVLPGCAFDLPTAL